jgi:hypothetical protein
MKKLFFPALLCLATSLNAQVFNTAGTLKPGRFSAGFEPGIYINGNTDFNLFLHGGAGITQGIDFGLKLGVLGDETYFGGDIEFALAKIFSLSGGAHSYGNFGLDFTALFTFPLGTSVSLYTGLDSDIVFAEPETLFPLWVPLGVEIPLKKPILFLFETEINITDVGSHFIGGGLNFIF